MDSDALLIEFYDRLPDLVQNAVQGLDADQLIWEPAPGANTIGWLTWHLTRVMDDHVAELMGEPQVYSEEHARRFGLANLSDTGYGHTAGQVSAVRPESEEAITRYFTAVHDRVRKYLETLSPADLDDVVDENWDPPVTRGVRLVSVYDDCAQHAGQAAYVRGLLP